MYRAWLLCAAAIAALICIGLGHAVGLRISSRLRRFEERHPLLAVFLAVRSLDHPSGTMPEPARRIVRWLLVPPLVVAALVFIVSLLLLVVDLAEFA